MAERPQHPHGGPGGRGCSPGCRAETRGEGGQAQLSAAPARRCWAPCQRPLTHPDLSTAQQLGWGRGRLLPLHRGESGRLREEEVRA